MIGVESTALAAFQCPSSDSLNALVQRAGGNTNSLGAPSNYAGVNGAAFSDPVAPASIGTNGGTFGGNSKVGIRDMTDGTSNTVMVGERGWFELSNSIWGTLALWAGAHSTGGGNVNAVSETANGAGFVIGHCQLKINYINSAAFPSLSCLQSFHCKFLLYR